MRKFTCIGAECEDTCCSGWKITIDEATFKKYQKIKDLELLPIIQESIKKETTPSKTLYASIKMDEENNCPFINEGMCSVQKKFGERYLSYTCYTYPRQLSQIDGVLEISAHLSCPEAARLALLNPDGIEFDEVEEHTGDRKLTGIKINADKGTIQEHFWSMRIFTIQVLQNRKFRVDDRLIILGLFFEKIQELIEANRIDNIPITIMDFNQVLGDEQAMQSALAEFRPESTALINTLKIISGLQQFRVSPHPRYTEYVNQFRSAIGLDSDIPDEEKAERYKTANQQYYMPFMLEHEYILENYLVNYVFMYTFPIDYGTIPEQRGIFDNFIKIVFHYSLIKSSLIGLAGYHKGLTQELVVGVIQSFSRVTEHARETYVLPVIDYMKKENLTTTSRLCIMIKI